MAEQGKKFNMENLLNSENISSVKEEECEIDDFVVDRVCHFETVFCVDNAELQEKIKENDDNIKTELSPSEIQYNINDNVKIEGISADIKIESDRRILYCEHCQAYYEDYCIECGMLVHILNRNALDNSDNGMQEELPNDILEIQHLYGQFGIFALKVIPGGVKFGPFTGLCRTECAWKIKEGKFVVDKDRSKYLNWMWYINPAKNICERNLIVFEYENYLYYRSTRQIQAGEELLLYIGDEYEDSLNKNIEVDFLPTREHIVEDVFACTFCCLGFSSISYLTKHKTICHESARGAFSNEALMQCPVCKIHLAQMEYIEHHITYCQDENIRKCIPFPLCIQTTDEDRYKSRSRQIYNCELRKYRTKYKGDLTNHTIQHYEVKMYKCGTCKRRFKTKEYLKLHMECTHASVSENEEQGSSMSDCTDTQAEVKGYKCSFCVFRTKYKGCLKRHMKVKHLKEFNYRCGACYYQTYRKSNLEYHMKLKHVKEFNFQCDICYYQTNDKSNLNKHMKLKHLKVFNHRCDLCDYETNQKLHLTIHIKAKHFHESNYRRKHADECYECDQCEFRTNWKSSLKMHTKTKHSKEFYYTCKSETS